MKVEELRRYTAEPLLAIKVSGFVDDELGSVVFVPDFDKPSFEMRVACSFGSWSAYWGAPGPDLVGFIECISNDESYVLSKLWQRWGKLEQKAYLQRAWRFCIQPALDELVRYLKEVDNP